MRPEVDGAAPPEPPEEEVEEETEDLDTTQIQPGAVNPRTVRSIDIGG